MEEWKEYKIGDLYEVHNGLSKGGKFFGSGFPFLSFKVVFNHFFIPSTLSDLVNTSEKERMVFNIKRGDVFITRTSENAEELGMSCVALKDYPDATYNGFTKRLRPKNDEVVPEYIGYYLRSSNFRSVFYGLASSMSTRASLSNGDLLNMTIKLPPVCTQKRIAAILKSLDDKIECNRQINDNLPYLLLWMTLVVLWLLKLKNDNLQSQAHVLFKSWFVDFEPFKDGEFVQSELGVIPKGWDVYELSNVLLPVSEKVGNRLLTEYSVGNNGIRSRSEIYHKTICSSPEKNRVIRKGNLVFGMGSDRVTWGIMKDEIGATSPAYPVFQIGKGIDPIYFEFFFDFFYSRSKDLIRPSVRQGQTIDKGALAQKRIYVPTIDVWNRYMQIFKPMADVVEILNRENFRLANLMDALIPRLMSEEIKISELTM